MASRQRLRRVVIIRRVVVIKRATVFAKAAGSAGPRAGGDWRSATTASPKPAAASASATAATPARRVGEAVGGSACLPSGASTPAPREYAIGSMATPWQPRFRSGAPVLHVSVRIADESGRRSRRAPLRVKQQSARDLLRGRPRPRCRPLVFFTGLRQGSGAAPVQIPTYGEHRSNGETREPVG